MTKALLRRHPLLLYFTMAFGTSWGGNVIVLASTGFSLAPLGPVHTSLLFLAMLIGPSLSGLGLTALADGRAGFGNLWARLLRWMVGVQWYAIALLTAPLLLLAILVFFGTFVAPAFAPQFQWPLFVVGLVAGSFEEIGWTGFATPRLLARYKIGIAGLLLGLIWAVWHLLVDFTYNSGAMGALWPVEFAVVYLATLTPYRMLMTWVYSNTESLLLAVIMHASFTGWLLVLFPAAAPAQNLLWQSMFALALWLAVGIALRANAHLAKAIVAAENEK